MEFLWWAVGLVVAWVVLKYITGAGSARGSGSARKATGTPIAAEESAGSVDGPPLPGDSTFRLSVAGTQHYAENLDTLFSSQAERAQRAAGHDTEPGDTETVKAAATLRFDDSNAFDPNAVEVLMAGRRVGFLPKGMAPHFRHYVRSKGHQGNTFRCLAEVDLPLYPGELVSEIRLDLPKFKT